MTPAAEPLHAGETLGVILICSLLMQALLLVIVLSLPNNQLVPPATFALFSFGTCLLGMFVMNVLVGGYAFSMYVVYAMIGLAGIVVNDSLVLIDFVNRERERGLSPAEAVRTASRHRFRPILLTTLTTVLGLLPMALGITGYSMVFGPFAAAIVFGLASASALTLLVVPAMYLGLEDARTWLSRIIDSRFRRRRGRGEVGIPG